MDLACSRLFIPATSAIVGIEPTRANGGKPIEA